MSYLHRNENVDALTLAYCVDNQDGSRTELNRVGLETVLMQWVDGQPQDLERRAKVMAAELRGLAQRFEQAATGADDERGEEALKS